MKIQPRLWNVPLLSVAFVSTMYTAAAVPPDSSSAPLTHPISQEPILSDGPAVEGGRSGIRSMRGEPLLAVSKAREAGKSALYSRDVNRIFCESSDKKTQRTWLGCALGLKLVDRKTGTVRHFGPAQGLPVGLAAAIASDASGDAWCIVIGEAQAVAASRNPGAKASPLYLCAFSPTTNQWRILRTVTPAAGYRLNSRSGYDDYSPGGSGRNVPFVAQSGRPRILVGGDTVTFSLGAAAASESVVLYQWDRKKKSFQTIAWEAGIRADNPALFTTFLGSDAVNGLWIGTNAGLMHYAAASPTGPHWSRTLPDQVIGEGVSAVGGNGVWVTATPRKAPTDPYNAYSPQISWSLYRVTRTATGAAQTRDRTPQAKSEPDNAPSASALPRPFRLDRFVPNAVFPNAVSIDTDGALWLTQKGTVGSGTNLSMMMGPGGKLDAWWRLDPKGSGWTRYEMRLPTSPSSGFNTYAFLRKTTASGDIYDNVSLSVLSEEAVLPLVIYTVPRDNHTFTNVSGFSIHTAQEDVDAVFWMRRRFPAWICADDIGSAFGDTDGFNLARRVNTASMGPIDDPAGPAGMVWVMDLKGTTLLHLPRTAMPADLREAREKGMMLTSPGPVAESNPAIERFPFPAGKTIQIRPNITVMVSARGKTDRLYFASVDNKLTAFDTASGQFTPLSLPQSGIYPSRYNPPVITDDGGIILSSPNSSSSQAIRIDPKDGSTRVLTSLEIGSRVFGVAPNGGLWITTQSGKISFQEPGTATQTPLPDDMKGPQNGNSPLIAATGAIAWTFPGKEPLVGYDIERKRRTPPIDLRNPKGYGNRILKLIDDGKGGAYVASETGEVGVYHYDRERNAWEVAAPPPPVPASDSSDPNNHFPPLLASVDTNALWLLADARWLMRFDRAKKVWDEPIALPVTLRRSRSSDETVSVLPAENNDVFYVGDQTGLWRYGIKDKTWTERRQTLPIPASDSVPSDLMGRLYPSSLFATGDSVFTFSSYANGSAYFAARLDLRTKEWSVYDETKGFPARNAGMRLASGGGDSVWLLHSSGTYLFDAKRDLWRLVFGSTENGLAPGGEPLPPVALEAGKKAAPDGIPNYRIVDIATDPKSSDSFLLGATQSGQSVVLRCDPSGKILARSEPPKGGQYARGSSLLYDNGAVLIAANTGVYQAFGTGSETVWKPVPAPSGLELPGDVTLLRKGPNGQGLYVMNTDSVAYWAHH